MVGKTISHYKILEKIGQGGMGEVFLAQDTTLDRKVALKFLSEEMQQNSTARQRFLREAKSAAALDHPYICKIYEIGEEEEKSFIAMEYIQGTTLGERLAGGPLSLKEALEKASEIAEALAAAHKEKIIHRDLKPSNIMLAPDGHVKVTDFGLAKRVTAAEGEEQDITTALTREGATLGTVPYMSPEQVRGQIVDTRSDIFAFGVVLCEMLTGVNPFKRETSLETATAILTEAPPPLTRDRNDISVLLRHTVKKMLAKEPDRRYQLIHDVRTDLGELVGHAEERSIQSQEKALQDGVDPGGPASQAKPWRQAVLWALTSLLLIALTGITIWNLRPRASPTVQRFPLTLPQSQQLLGALFGLASPVIALSPDGRHLVYVANEQLYLRPMDSWEGSPISGTEGSWWPFFSPDGQWVGFFSDNKLKKVSVNGGAPQILGDAPTPRGASWGADDTIVLGTGRSGLSQVSAAGGTLEVLTTLDSEAGDIDHRFPQVLADGQTVLFIATRGTGLRGNLEVMSLETGERKVLLEGATYASYVPTGHLVYSRVDTPGTLWAVPFELSRLEVVGAPVPILEGVMQTATSGVAQFTFSELGEFVYVPGEGSGHRLVWVDRQGVAEPVGAPPGHRYFAPRLSPDGGRLAVAIAPDIWIYDLPREILTRLTFEGQNDWPLWTPDGKRVIFRSDRDGVGSLFWKAADGGGEEERLTVSEHLQRPDSLSPDGRILAFDQADPTTGSDIWVLPLEGEREPRPFLQARFNDSVPQFSADGRWLAYVSDESGRYEVYVRPFPGSGGKLQISIEGGIEPVWARTGELFYRNQNGNQMWAVDIETEPALRAGTPRLLFEGMYLRIGSGASRAFYDVTADGQRFLMVQQGELKSEARQINVVLNWFEELKGLVPANP